MPPLGLGDLPVDDSGSATVDETWTNVPWLPVEIQVGDGSPDEQTREVTFEPRGTLACVDSVRHHFGRPRGALV